MPGRVRRIVALLVAAAALTGAWCASAGAATVLVGSPMTSPDVQPGTFGSVSNTETVANVTLDEAGAHVASPVNGTVVSWSINTEQTTGNYALRILRPAGGDQYAAVASVPQFVTGIGVHTFSANLPIQTGDLIGLDLPQGVGPAAGVRAFGFLPNSSWIQFDPAIPAGGTDSPTFPPDQTRELAINATVQYPDAPTSSGKSKKCKKKKHKRSAESAKKKCKKKKKR
jgi:hypothetical protein